MCSSGEEEAIQVCPHPKSVFVVLGSHRTYRDSQSAKSPSPLPSLPDMNLAYLELMHHYSTSTARTFHDFGDGGKRWEVIVPSQAQSYEFLMHALLGVSALHIVHLRGRDSSTSQYLSRAHAHHAEALALFRSSVTDITPMNGAAVAAFSCLFLVFSCGTAQLSDTLPNQDPIDILLTIVGFFRTYWKLFVSTTQWLDAPSPQASPSPPMPEPDLSGVKENAAMRALDELLRINTSSSDDEVCKAIYHGAIIQMQRSLDSGSALPRFLWPLTVSDEYLTLLEQRQPMALIILAHGCTLTKELPCRWFIHNWITHITNSIARQIDVPWRPTMRWPLEQCGLLLEAGGTPTLLGL